MASTTHKPDRTDWIMASGLGLTYPSNRKADRAPRPPRTPSESLVEGILCSIAGPLDQDLFTRSTSLEIDIGMDFADRVELVMELEEKLSPFLPNPEIDDLVAESWETVGHVIEFVEHTLLAIPDRQNEALPRMREENGAGDNGTGDNQSGHDTEAGLRR